MKEKKKILTEEEIKAIKQAKNKVLESGKIVKK